MASIRLTGYFAGMAGMVAAIMQQHPTASKRRALAHAVGSWRYSRTNPVRPRFSGAKEIERRRLQIAKGFKQVHNVWGETNNGVQIHN